MSEELPDTVPLRTLRNEVSRVVRAVREDGRSFRISVDGLPVAELRAIDARPRFVSRAAVLDMCRQAPLDPGFREDVRGVLNQRIDEL